MRHLSQGQLAGRVQRAITDAGMKQNELADLIGVDKSALSRALNGQRQFKSLEIALIAEVLRIPVQQLLSAEPDSDPALIAARTQPNESPAIGKAIRKAQDILELDDLLTELGYQNTSKVHDFLEVIEDDGLEPYREGELLADHIRSVVGLNNEDLPADLNKFATYVEDCLGIDVCFEPLPDGLDGLSVSRNHFKLALISSQISATRQRYTLAHEICHLLMGDSQDLQVDENVFGKKTPDETRANSFAASFLMPRTALQESASGVQISESFIASLLGRYRVSLDALAFRLHNTGVVNAAARDRVRAMSSSTIVLRAGRAEDLQARNDRRVPMNLLNRAIQAYVEKTISIRPIANLIGIDADQLLEELSPAYGPGRFPVDDTDEMVPVL
jgi:Zn-dependent peptidase ImmA (M78 family)/transcriptional regulator with XRE-family HTH domain